MNGQTQGKEYLTISMIAMGQLNEVLRSQTNTVMYIILSATCTITRIHTRVHVPRKKTKRKKLERCFCHTHNHTHVIKQSLHKLQTARVEHVTCMLQSFTCMLLLTCMKRAYMHVEDCICTYNVLGTCNICTRL